MLDCLTLRVRVCFGIYAGLSLSKRHPLGDHSVGELSFSILVKIEGINKHIEWMHTSTR